MSSKPSGDQGENEIVKNVRCPNCGKKLMRLPRNFSLYDIQCKACFFRAQIKTNRCKPKKEIFGAGWEIINKVLKSGYFIPPLIANFKWVEKGKTKKEIRFYPFITRSNLKKYPLSRRPNEYRFNYVGMDKLPHFILTPRG